MRFGMLLGNNSWINAIWLKLISWPLLAHLISGWNLTFWVLSIFYFRHSSDVTNQLTYRPFLGKTLAHLFPHSLPLALPLAVSDSLMISRSRFVWRFVDHNKLHSEAPINNICSRCCSCCCRCPCTWLWTRPARAKCQAMCSCSWLINQYAKWHCMKGTASVCEVDGHAELLIYALELLY